MLADCASLLLAIIAVRVSQRPATGGAPTGIAATSRSRRS